MKLKQIITCFVMACVTTLSLNAKTGPEDRQVFYPFLDEETGLYGIKYNDEVVMLPYFQKLEGGGTSPIFYYFDETDNTKMGIFTLQGFLTAPVFDEIKDNNARYRLGRIGKTWYIITENGPVSLPFACDDIARLYWFENGKTYIPSLVLKPKGGKWSIFTPGGLDLLEGSKLTDFEPGKLKIYNYSRKAGKTISKRYKNYEKQAKKDPEIAKKLKFEDGVVITLGNTKELDENIPSVPIEIGGFKGVINELGIIDIPVKYNMASEILERDPDNIYALEFTWLREIPYAPSHGAFDSQERFDEIERMRAENNLKRAATYQRLAEKAIADGWDKDSPLVQKYLKNGNVEGASQRLNKLVSEQQKRYEREARINAIGNALSGVLNQAAATFGGGGYSAPVYSTSSLTNIVGTSDSPASSKPNLPSDNKYNVSEQMRCNSDKSVYSRYESMISKARANGSASPSEIKGWQDKMKSLRKKWENKGYSFPHSSLED